MYRPWTELPDTALAKRPGLVRDAYYRWARGLGYGVCRLFFSLHSQGAGNVPARGPAVLVSNHPSYLEPVFMLTVCPRPAHVMTWASAFSNPVLGAFLETWGSLPVDLSTVSSAPLRRALKLLSAGRMVGVYFEGERSVGPYLRPDLLKHGAVQLALMSGAPIVPVTVVGAYGLWPPYRMFPQRRAVRVIFHPALRDLPCDRHARRDRRVQQDIQERLAEIINAPLRAYYGPRLTAGEIRRYERRNARALEAIDAAHGIPPLARLAARR